MASAEVSTEQSNMLAWLNRITKSDKSTSIVLDVIQALRIKYNEGGKDESSSK